MAGSQPSSLVAILQDLKNDVDVAAFEQILEMDDDDEREFSRTLVFEFLNQAKDTFAEIEESLAKKDLQELSHQGHYLKGSSATLGLIKIRDSCEKIQRYGSNENVDGSEEKDSELCLSRIKDTLKVLRADFGDVRKAMKRLYNQDIEDEEDEEDEEEEEEGEEERASADTEKAVDTKDTKKAEEAKDATVTKDTTDAKVTKDTTDAKVTKDTTDAKVTNDTKETKGAEVITEKTKAVPNVEPKVVGTA